MGAIYIEALNIICTTYIVYIGLKHYIYKIFCISPSSCPPSPRTHSLSPLIQFSSSTKLPQGFIEIPTVGGII